ncbi:glutamate racemase [Marinagarivorans algicola]|uniref:glutamate racemase n=1 Tax=Marinagarivorans algicola TaxID=1513270 RepID=UPI0037358ABF
MHIAFFDSGLGGLSIAQAFFTHPKSASVAVRQCSYIADTGAFPYGDKTDLWLIERITTVVRAAMERIQPDLVVVACNTASTLALTSLRQVFNIPFIGVVPAIKPAAHASTTGVIGVLATPATVARDYTAQLIADYAPKQRVLLYGCTELVAQAERHLLHLPVDTHILQQALKGLLQQANGYNIDTIVLACTHFPLLKEALAQQWAQLCPNRVQWVDSGEAIARRIIELAPCIDRQDTTGATDNILSKPAVTQLVTTGGPLAAQYTALLQQQPQWLGAPSPATSPATTKTTPITAKPATFAHIALTL